MGKFIGIALSAYDRRRTVLANRREVCAGVANEARRTKYRDDLEYQQIVAADREIERLQILGAYQFAAKGRL